MTRVKPEEVTLQTIVLEGNYCLRFFYYMYGADTDDLKVAVHSIYNSSAITEYFSHRKRKEIDERSPDFYFTNQHHEIRGYR
ncbi:hypothetical protein TNCT_674191, partial [Trichonephila clavata]